MEIQLVSDLHIEGMRWDAAERLIESLKTDANILIAAGDICNERDMKNVFTQFCDNYNAVIFVNGNHEYYNSSFSDVHFCLQDCVSSLPNLHWLNIDNSVTIAGQRFIGDTLWYPRNPTALKLIKYWSDYEHIKDLIPEVWNLNENAINYFVQNLQEDDIVVTHMSPSYRSVGKEYTDDPYNCFFSNELDALIRAKKPSHWFHGHHHDLSDYVIGDTRIIANPRGYTNQGEGQDFDPNLIIKV